MKILRTILDKQGKLFEKGAPLERFYAFYEAGDTFVFTPGNVTSVASHVRDGLDLKRMMITVVVALSPCMFMAMYNTGYQAGATALSQVPSADSDGDGRVSLDEFTAADGLAPGELARLDREKDGVLTRADFLLLDQNNDDMLSAGDWLIPDWRTQIFQAIGFDHPNDTLTYLLFGALFYLPIYFVTLAVGATWEGIFAVIRRHEINEGFLVTSALFPLILAPTVPLWQVALGISFGVVIGKEIFGGIGMNILNPALTARAFLFFAYPAQLSGDKVWIASQIDGTSGATLLARAFDTGAEALPSELWWDAFIGLIPGSLGETSALFCLFGAVVLVVAKIGSWRTMAGCVVGSLAMILLLNQLATIESVTNPFFDVPFYWHWVLGGFAFAIVFMATDPVSSAFTNTGKLIYGFSIGVLGILIRVLNPAYPEGWMLAILFMNMFAPLIDHFIVQRNVKRRAARYAA